MTKPNTATEALQRTYSLKHSSTATYALFKEFTDSFEKLAPDGQFSVQDVRSWYEAYRELTPSKAPSVDTFANSYALGRFMKQHQEQLGIKLLGTYGNRHIYTVIPKTKTGAKS